MSPDLLGRWILNCKAPFEAKMWESGDYYFRIRPADASGNIGAISDAMPFTVDAKLSEAVVIGEE